LGAAVLGLAVLTRLAHRLGFSAIPPYLLGGLAFDNGGLLPLHFTEELAHGGRVHRDGLPASVWWGSRCYTAKALALLFGPQSLLNRSRIVKDVLRNTKEGVLLC
jgi:hypothetical protein